MTVLRFVAICISMIRSLAALLFLTSVAAQAGDEVDSIPLPVSAPALAVGVSQPLPAGLTAAPSSKANFSNATPAVSLAMCGVEAHGTATDLDAGLIDFNVADPARAAGGSPDVPKDQAQNVRDFHSSIVLGVTLGYRF